MKDAINRFKQYVEQRYPDRSTSKHYMSDLAIFHQNVGDVHPKTITAGMVSDFVEAQSNQGLKGSTINRRLSALSSFFEFLIYEAEDDDWSNPVQWKRHSIRPGHHLPRDVSDQTVSQFLAVIEDLRDRAIFGLMINAGLRVGEVVELQLNDLHPLEQNGLARLRVRGKGDKERLVWLTAEVVHHIQPWLQQRPQSDSPYLYLKSTSSPLKGVGRSVPAETILPTSWGPPQLSPLTSYLCSALG